MSLSPPPGWQPKFEPVFKDFLKRVFTEFLNLPEPTLIQNAIADFMQLRLHKEVDGARAMVEAYRGFGKSWITDIFAVWLLDQNPNHKVEIVSASEDLAKDNAEFIRKIIREYAPCAHLRVRKGQKNKAHSFDVGPAATSKDPSVKTAGITGQITGTRATIIISDDVEVPKNSLTHGMREKLKQLITEYDSIIVSGGHILYLGTPQSIESIYNDLPTKGYTVCTIPSEVPDKPENYEVTVYRTEVTEDGEFFEMPHRINKLHGIIRAMIANGVAAGTAVDPKRFDNAALHKKKKSMGASNYLLQFMLDTTLSDLNRYPLKLRDLIVMPIQKEKAPAEATWMPDEKKLHQNVPSVGLKGDAYYGPHSISDLFVGYDFTVMAIDPSGSGEDETAYAIIKVCRGMLYLVATGGLMGGYSTEVLTELADLAKLHGVNSVVIENNFGQGMFEVLFRPYLLKKQPASIEGRTVRQAKEERIIDTLEPVLNQHRLVVSPEVILKDLEDSQRGGSKDGVKSLFFQLSRMQKLKDCLQHDDRVDALEAAVWKCMSMLGLDTTTQEADVEAQQKDETSRRFVEKHKQLGTYDRFVRDLPGYKPPTATNRGLGLGRRR